MNATIPDIRLMLVNRCNVAVLNCIGFEYDDTRGSHHVSCFVRAANKRSLDFGSQFHSAQAEGMAVMLLLQSSRAVTARLKRESGRERDLGTSSRQRAHPVLQPRNGKLGHQAPAIQRRDVGMSCTGGGTCCVV